MLEGNEAAKGQRVAAYLATVLGVAATLIPAFSLKGEGEDGGRRTCALTSSGVELLQVFERKPLHRFPARTPESLGGLGTGSASPPGGDL